VSSSEDHRADHRIPAPGEPSTPELEIDESIAPRPEEEIADLARAEPDLDAHAPAGSSPDTDASGGPDTQPSGARTPDA